jgi:mono/diheme cytochrome c family protein
MIAAVFGAAVAASHSLGRQQSSGTGYFSSEQAKRGEGVYLQYCVVCHGQSLTGADEATPLTGPRFTSNWNRRTVGDLFTRIRTTMPPGVPNQLTRQQTADVLAFILKYNKVPTGSAELPLQLELLKRIELVFEPIGQ